ncbi:MAG: hypothetical protein AB7U20_04910 [Planctomycetaceae bacterium]
MASTREVSRSRDGLTDWERQWHRRLVLPSWLLSALLHGALLAVFIWLSQSRGCRPDYAGDEGDGFRTVGVYLTTGDTEEEPSEEPAEESPTAPSEPLAAIERTPLLDAPPISVERPTNLAKSVLGLGGVPEFGGASSPVPSLATTPMAGPPPTNRAVLGKSTSLFGIQDAGKRFVYVLDRSGSMEDGPLRSAKAELMASLENLDATQEFQVIFYNTLAVPLVPRGGRFEMFRGIDTHRLEVERQLGSIQSDGGTSHRDALEASLRYNADVIFFLTDADELNLNAHELASITRRNNGGARIHCIEFGDGPSLSRPGGPGTSLQKLAEQNGGQYQYRDVRRLQ